MNIVALTDIHGDTNQLTSVEGELSSADMVLLVGDITHFGRIEDAEKVIRSVRRFNDQVFAIAGNCDFPEVNDYLENEDIDLHGKCRSIKGISFIGIGGSLPCPGRTPNELSENAFSALLDRAVSGLTSEMPGILVSHQPPFGTLNDTVGGGDHVGSKAIRTFIEEREPVICFTGHIHEAAGTDHIGKTTVVNPGPFRGGSYAVAEVGAKLSLLEIRNAVLRYNRQMPE